MNQHCNNKPELKVLKPDSENIGKYCDIIGNVFHLLDRLEIKKSIERFNEQTRLYVFEDKDKYLSVAFISPIEIGSVLFGGIGGVSTRIKYRKQGYSKNILRKIIADTKDVYSALLLWTWIPVYFQGIGFEDASAYFSDDVKGSMPMIYFFQKKEKLLFDEMNKLPRVYF